VPLWYLAAAIVLWAVGLSFEFAGRNGNSIVGAVLCLLGSLALMAYSLTCYVILRHRRPSGKR